MDLDGLHLSGNELPSEAEILSPSVSLTAQGALLLVPVREKVADGRTAKVRMKEQTKICSAQFTNEDAFAVEVVLDEEGIDLYKKVGRGIAWMWLLIQTSKELLFLCRIIRFFI